MVGPKSCWNRGSHSSSICELPGPQILPRGSVGQPPPGLGPTPHSARFPGRVFPAAPGAAPPTQPPPLGGEAGALRGPPSPNSLLGPLLGVASRRRRTSFQSMADSRAAAPAFANRSPRHQLRPQPAAGLPEAAEAARPPSWARAEVGHGGKTVNVVTAEKPAVTPTAGRGEQAGEKTENDVLQAASQGHGARWRRRRRGTPALGFPLARRHHVTQESLGASGKRFLHNFFLLFLEDIWRP